MRRHLLAATAIASFAVCTSSNLIAQTALPGYAASVLGAGSTTTNTAFNIITFNSGWNANYHIYVNAVQCGRTDAGTSAITVTFNDTASTVMVVPASHGGYVTFNSPSTLDVAANTNFTGTASSGVTTLYCSAQGFVAN